MPNQRAKDKKMVGFFATEEEAKLLKDAAKLAGFDTLADYLRWIAKNQPGKNTAKKSPKKASSDKK